MTFSVLPQERTGGAVASYSPPCQDLPKGAAPTARGYPARSEGHGMMRLPFEMRCTKSKPSLIVKTNPRRPCRRPLWPGGISSSSP